MKLESNYFMDNPARSKVFISSSGNLKQGKYFNLNIVSSYYMQYWWLNHNYLKKISTVHSFHAYMKYLIF